MYSNSYNLYAERLIQLQCVCACVCVCVCVLSYSYLHCILENYRQSVIYVVLKVFMC